MGALWSYFNCFKPNSVVEQSVFGKTGAGRKIEKLPISQKLYELVVQIINKLFHLEQLEGYAPTVNYGLGIFLKCVAIVLYGYFIGSTYVTTANTQFISLDPSAGACTTVPVAITNTFTLDSNGSYWLGNALYNPSQGMYTVTMNNFQHSLAEYQAFMAYTRSIIASQLASPSEHRDLSKNLLHWVAWSLFVTEGSVQHRWTMTGDAKVLLARQNYYGSLSKQSYDCRLPGTVTYDRSTGKFTMTYSYKDYSTSDYCKTILKDTDVGYNAIANGDNLVLSWDGVSLLMARAVNKGVISMNDLITAKSGLPSQQFTVDGVVYTTTNRIDSRYTDMAPIICFKPNLVSTAPSMAPTPFSTTTKVQLTQSFLGIAFSVATTKTGNAAITNAIASVAQVPPFTVSIQSITPVTGGRRNLRNNDYDNYNNNVDSFASQSSSSSWTAFANSLGLGLGLGHSGGIHMQVSKISVRYTITVTLPNPPPEAILVASIKAAVAKDGMNKALATSGGADFFSAVADLPTVIDLTPTNTPTSAPSYKPTPGPTNATRTPTIAPSLSPSWTASPSSKGTSASTPTSVKAPTSVTAPTSVSAPTSVTAPTSGSSGGMSSSGGSKPSALLFNHLDSRALQGGGPPPGGSSGSSSSSSSAGGSSAGSGSSASSGGSSSSSSSGGSQGGSTSSSSSGSGPGGSTSSSSSGGAPGSSSGGAPGGSSGAPGGSSSSGGAGGPGGGLFGTSGGATTHYTVSASDYPSFCLVRIHNLLGFPFYTHKGPSGYDGYHKFVPRPCHCEDGTGNSTHCNQFDIVSGFVLFPSTDLQAIIQFALAVQKLGDLNDLVFNASFASLSFTNGQGDPHGDNYGVKNYAAGSPESNAFSLMQTESWRKQAYTWCNHGCLGVVSVTSYDAYDTAVNGEFHQVVNGSCRDTFTVNGSAWDRAYANPPIQLVQDYVKCHYTPFNCVITAFGVGSGTANACVPVSIIFFCFLIAHCGCPKMKLQKDLYTEDEREKAVEHLATHLLMIRDAEAIRKKQGKKPNVASKFLGDLIEGSDDLFQAELYAATNTQGTGKEETKTSGGGGGGGNARVVDMEMVPDYIPPPRVKSLPRRGGGVSIADYEDDENMFGGGLTRATASSINAPTSPMGRDELDDGLAVEALSRPSSTAQDRSFFSYFSPRL